VNVQETGAPRHDYYRALRIKTTIRLSLLYLSPVVILTVYILLQYGVVLSENERLHLKAIAESQANTMDLFLSERRVNLSNLIDDPAFPIPPTSKDLEDSLEDLRKISDAFADVGYFDSSGVQIAYAGPFPSLESRSYRSEDWYRSLRERRSTFIVTDIYAGFRQKPHFTIAVSRVTRLGFVVLRATLDPERINRYISSIEGSAEVLTSIVDREGRYQLVASSVGDPLTDAPFVPSQSPRQGAVRVDIGGNPVTYGYSWLNTVDWSLLVRRDTPTDRGFYSGFPMKIIGFSAAAILIGFFVIVNRAKKRVELQHETDNSRAQLGHAAKLASVGELAAGIAHEINNPLAAINEEAGLMKDLMDPAFGEPVDPKELIPYLDSIHESVFRCRDITRKLLGFVRRTEMDFKVHNIHELIDDVVDGLLGREMEVSNIEVVRRYDESIPEIVTDGNQLRQVFLNILNNAIDAMEGKPGRVTISTEPIDGKVCIGLADTGKGMSQQQLNNIFVPFYTTKEVGKGTGLGLSVSYGIIKNLGGKIEVHSRLGEGSTFTIRLPADQKNPRKTGRDIAQR
jgi:two-component system NtrC family sensor kinase